MDTEDELLGRELSKVGAFTDKLGGSSIYGAGGSLGANLAARFLPTERFQTELKLNADPRMVLEKVYAFIISNGHIEDSAALRDAPFPTISGVVGSGFLNMNPAIVQAEIVAVEGESCTIVLTGAGKEGLIKQRTAEKAVTRLAETLQVS